MSRAERLALLGSMFGPSFALILLELVLTRVFGVVLFASFAHLALAVALLGIAAGALAQHLWPQLVPEDGLLPRVGWLGLYLAAAALLAVVATVALPLTVQFAEPPVTYGERSSVAGSLIAPGWFSVLLPLLALPFGLGGLIFAGVFERRKAWIGELYAADLVGGAAGALVFLPLLYAVPGPDAVFAVVLASCLAAIGPFAVARRPVGAAIAIAGALGSAVLLVAATHGPGLLPVRYAAGYSEQNITWVRWTPLTRLAIHQDDRGDYMLLDNTSASEIVTTPARRRARAREANRAAVYHLHQPPARVAILAASAGPEISAAQQLGFEDIDAIDIAPEIGAAVAEHFADAPLNPYRSPRVHRILLDGRAAILHSTQPYDIIQMVHANLHSSAGLLSSAWSPSLLETRQAFETYLDHLSPEGTLSFARGPRTVEIVPAVVAALRSREVEQPEQNLLLITGDSTVLLAKKRPFTRAERDRLATWLAGLHNHQILFDPIDPDPELWRRLSSAPVFTDAHPYVEGPGQILREMGTGLATIGSGRAELPPTVVLYRTLGLQLGFVALAGIGLVALPWGRRRWRGEAAVPGAWPVLGFVACLGYGYLAVETVLIHELVLFVGHPIYAVTVVILAMLLLSGLGSLAAQRIPESGIEPALRRALTAVVILGALQAWIVPPMLHRVALGLPLGARAAITFAALTPLGFAMGMPFPLGIRLLRPAAAPVVPWAWALNGWTSVVATLGTVLISRAFGYPYAFAVALAAYALAFSAVGALRRAG